MVYFKNLDFLRFMAVFLVLFQHWLDFNFVLDIGAIGVTIFFVLSGFLITRILLVSKEKINKNELTLKKAFINFYVRRSIRIFPIYFGLLLFLYVFNYKTAVDNIGWLLTYTSNIKTYLDQSWMRTLGPIWSLAVEEQFYLVWPAVILMLSKENLKRVLIACLIVGPLFRLIFMGLALLIFEPVNLKISSTVMMPANIDLFAIGGVLAYNLYYKTRIVNVSNRVLLMSSVIGFIGICFFMDTVIYHMLFVLIIGVWSFLLIRYMISNKSDKLSKIFQFKPSVFLGKISYGLYLFHGPFFFIYAIISFSEYKILGSNFLKGLHSIEQFKFIKQVIFLVLLCTLSWYIIENPINKLKRYFT